MPITQESQAKVANLYEAMLDLPMSLYVASKTWNVITETADIDTFLEITMQDGTIWNVVDAKAQPGSYDFWRITLAPVYEDEAPYRQILTRGGFVDFPEDTLSSPVRVEVVETVHIDARLIDQVLIKGY